MASNLITVPRFSVSIYFREPVGLRCHFSSVNAVAFSFVQIWCTMIALTSLLLLYIRARAVQLHDMFRMCRASRYGTGETYCTPVVPNKTAS